LSNRIFRVRIRLQSALPCLQKFPARVQDEQFSVYYHLSQQPLQACPTIPRR
jgi:hypothetical protein